MIIAIKKEKYALQFDKLKNQRFSFLSESTAMFARIVYAVLTGFDFYQNKKKKKRKKERVLNIEFT